MRRPLPPLTALRAFEAAARHVSFKLAAEELHVTPSAVSHGVQALEDHLGVKLFHRLTRRLVLTDAGTAYADPLRRAFDAIGTATADVIGRSHADLLSVGSVPTFARVWLLPRLKDFIAAHPDIDIRLKSTWGPDDVLHDDVDAGIAYGYGDWPGVRTQWLMNETTMPFCAPSLRDGTPPLREPADLRHHTLIHTETKMTTWAMWLEAAGIEGVDAHRGLRFNRTNLAMEAAINGLGVALDNITLAEPQLASGALVIPFDVSVVLERIAGYYLIWRDVHHDTPKLAAFRAWIAAQAATAGVSPSLHAERNAALQKAKC